VLYSPNAPPAVCTLDMPVNSLIIRSMNVMSKKKNREDKATEDLSEAIKKICRD
jgi:hypothetical protein